MLVAGGGDGMEAADCGDEGERRGRWKMKVNVRVRVRGGVL